ncbi:hypothetical protein CPB84DRAFT_184594 [Gymnopilus junonius]|uniref:Uncharacterized protein n=1 Tax=Gymnopilus junonius TaxID=109634 RepID=A0A9P5NFH7_GYMJU|nr:hypothetical protein CPB84DRAFT_184594 [Gymnopilus junonius]
MSSFHIHQRGTPSHHGCRRKIANNLLNQILQHFTSEAIELYQAFIPPSNASYCVQGHLNPLTPADAAYLNLANHYNIAGSVFFIATMVFGDWFLTYRLYVVWGRNIIISIPPALFSIGALVCGSAVGYLFSRADPTVFTFADKWITATFSLSVGCNIYSTFLIAFKLIGPWRQFRIYGLRRRVLEVLIQSAALYCALAILVLSFSLASTNLVYIATPLFNPVIGINFCLIVIRTHRSVSDVCVIRTPSERILFSDSATSTDV